jgi:hypothetical protein
LEIYVLSYKRVLEIYVFVDVVSSDICDEDQEKRDYARSISRMNTAGFRLVQALSESNSPMSSIIVLCCGKIGCPDELRAATYIVWRTAL